MRSRPGCRPRAAGVLEPQQPDGQKRALAGHGDCHEGALAGVWLEFGWIWLECQGAGPLAVLEVERSCRLHAVPGVCACSAWIGRLPEIARWPLCLSLLAGPSQMEVEPSTFDTDPEGQALAAAINANLPPEVPAPALHAWAALKRCFCMCRSMHCSDARAAAAQPVRPTLPPSLSCCLALPAGHASGRCGCSASSASPSPGTRDPSASAAGGAALWSDCCHCGGKAGSLHVRWRRCRCAFCVQLITEVAPGGPHSPNRFSSPSPPATITTCLLPSWA